MNHPEVVMEVDRLLAKVDAMMEECWQTHLAYDPEVDYKELLRRAVRAAILSWYREAVGQAKTLPIAPPEAPPLCDRCHHPKAKHSIIGCVANGNAGCLCPEQHAA